MHVQRLYRALSSLSGRFNDNSKQSKVEAWCSPKPTLGPKPAAPSATTDFDSASRSTSSSVLSPNTLTTAGASCRCCAGTAAAAFGRPQQPQGCGGASSAAAVAEAPAAAAAAGGLGATLTRMFEMPPEILVNCGEVA